MVFTTTDSATSGGIPQLQTHSLIPIVTDTLKVDRCAPWPIHHRRSLKERIVIHE